MEMGEDWWNYSYNCRSSFCILVFNLNFSQRQFTLGQSIINVSLLCLPAVLAGILFIISHSRKKSRQGSFERAPEVAATGIALFLNHFNLKLASLVSIKYRRDKFDLNRLPK
jgi:hypothetical protein